MNKTKKFDCVKMKHDIQEKIYEETKDMTWEQRQEYFKRNIEASPLAKLWSKLKARQDKGQKAS